MWSWAACDPWDMGWASFYIGCKTVCVILNKVFIIIKMNDFSKVDKIGLNTKVLLSKNVWVHNS